MIELMVVVTVIAILAALLLPALRSARERSTAICCASNLKQVGLIVGNYAGDHNGWGPPPLVNASVKWVNWLETQGYVGVNNPIMKCPTSKTPPLSTGYYGMRSILQDAGKSAINIYASPLVSTKNYKWDSPSEVIYIGDTLNPAKVLTGAFQQYYLLCDTNLAQGAGGLPHMRHFGKANIYYCDSHVSAIQSSELGDSVAPHKEWTWIEEDGLIVGKHPPY